MDTTNKISILSYNIHKGFSADHRRFVLHEIREELKKLHPDLLFLQEIQGEHTRREKKIEHWPDESQFKFLAKQLWPHFVYGKNAIYKSGHHGNAILSKFPFFLYENIDISSKQRSSRSILHGLVKFNDSICLHVICIHMSLFQSERKRQLTTLCERIESHVPHDEPLIIAGDFNDWRQDAENYLEAQLGLEEVFKTTTGNHAKTFPSIKPTLKVDRVYFRGLHVISAQRLSDEPWRHLSDHVPLHVEFSI